MLKSLMGRALLHSIAPTQKHLDRVFFHATSWQKAKNKKVDYRAPIDCPASKTLKCKQIDKQRCSSTDPPVRSCDEPDCAPEPTYPCCVDREHAKRICEMSKAKKIKPKTKFVSMWEKSINKEEPEYLMWNYPPECCPGCEDSRFDVLYYRPSNKCRKFQRTWWECCPRYVPKRICSACDAIPPENSIRCLPISPRSACTSQHEKKRMACIQKKLGACPRLTMPCCRAARVPPSCKNRRQPHNCTKINCPFPSYSECKREDPAIINERPHECRCLTKVDQCYVVRELMKKDMQDRVFCECPVCK